MRYLEWSKDLDVGVDAMNGEHQVLIDLMNRFVDAGERGDHAGLRRCLEKLRDFTAKHFEHEEAYMASIDFPDLTSHQRIHRKLIDAFDRHADPILAGSMDIQEFKVFLKMWLKSHIMGIDTKYGHHAHQKVA